MPGSERSRGRRRCIQAGQRVPQRALAAADGVGVPGNEGPQGEKQHFQAGQRAHLAVADGVLVPELHQTGQLPAQGVTARLRLARQSLRLGWVVLYG